MILNNVIVEGWELKIKLDSPSMLTSHPHRQEVEVTSVNWPDQDAAMRVSRVLVSYRWHGVVYVIEFSPSFFFHITSVRCWDVTKMMVLQHWPMDEWYEQRNPAHPACMPIYYTLTIVELFLYLRTASLRPHLGCQSTSRCMT